MSRWHKGESFGLTAKILYTLIVLAAVGAIGLVTYMMVDRPASLRGAQGTLPQNAPGTDPPPSVQPKGGALPRTK